LGSPDRGGVFSFEVEISTILEEVESELLFGCTKLSISTPTFESIRGGGQVGLVIQWLIRGDSVNGSASNGVPILSPCDLNGLQGFFEDDAIDLGKGDARPEHTDTPAVPTIIVGGVAVIRCLASIKEISQVLAKKTNACFNGVFGYGSKLSRHEANFRNGNINDIKGVPGADFGGGGTELSVVFDEKFFESNVGHMIFLSKRL